MSAIEGGAVHYRADDGRESVATIDRRQDERGTYYSVAGRRADGPWRFVCVSESYDACEAMARFWVRAPSVAAADAAGAP